MRAAFVFLFWGALMLGILLVGLLIYGFHDVAPKVLFAGTVVVMTGLGILVAGFRWDRTDDAYLRAHADISPPAAWLGFSVAVLAFSTEVGWWLSLIAGGMAAFGVGGIVRELLAERGAVRRAADRRRE